MSSICLFNQSFTKAQMREETDRCRKCMMKDCEYAGGELSRPPLGCKPYFIAIPERIRQLTNAIESHAECTTGIVTIWAREIELLSNVMREMEQV